MTTAKENLSKVLNHEDPGWAPVLAVTGTYNMPAELPRHLMKPKLDEIGLMRWLDCDILKRCGGVKEVRSDRVRTTERTEGDVTSAVIETPGGTLTAKAKRATFAPPDAPRAKGEDLDEAGDIETTYRVELPVKGREDYAALKSLFENTRYEPDTQALRKEMEAIGDDGFAMPCGPSTPFMQLVHSQVGIERLVEHLADFPEVIEDVLEVMTERYEDWMRVAAESEARAIMCSDDSSTDLISPDLFKRYGVPALRKAADICHAKGKFLVVHDCGRIRRLLPLFAETGVDAVECVCPPKTGDTPPGVARAAWGRKVVVIARIDPPILVRGTPDEVRRAVEDMMMQVVPGDNFAITLPCGRAPVENLRAAVRTVRRLGAFPMRKA